MAKIMLTIVSTLPVKNGAPGKITGATGEVKKLNKYVIINGPKMVVTLMTLVSAPCNSPCESGGTWLEIIPWIAGPAIPPMENGMMNAYIIQLFVAKAKSRK